MILKRVQTTVGTVPGTNCYIVKDEKTNEAIVIDPSNDIELLTNMLMAVSAKPKYIILSHCHGDHIAGAMKLKEEMGGKILIHREDEPGLREPSINLADYIGLRRNGCGSRQ